jgi:hypothetical protein
MISWFKKRKSIKDQLLYLSKVAKIFGLNEVDINSAKEYLQYNEYGVCFDILITQMHEQSIEIDNDIYTVICDVAKRMKIPFEGYSFMKELVRDSPQKSIIGMKYPFHEQVLTGEIENVRAVLAPEINLDELDGFGNSPLHWAVMGGYLDIVELLLNAGANPNTMSSQGYTPKWSAVDFGLKEIEILLTSFGGKIATNENFDNVSWSVFKKILDQPMPDRE